MQKYLTREVRDNGCVIGEQRAIGRRVVWDGNDMFGGGAWGGLSFLRNHHLGCLSQMCTMRAVLWVEIK